MTGQEADKVSLHAVEDVPGPDVMLKLWASWMDQMSTQAKAAAGPGTAWWHMTTDNPASGLFAGGAEHLRKSLSQDPALRSIDQMWNANPLREVVPVDWAEIARALRTVWLRSLSKPGDGHGPWWSSMPGPVALGARGLAGGRTALAGPGEAVAGERPSCRRGDKRFAAPEWHTNPVYRTLKEIYLLASDWLLQQGDAADDMDEAERQRINFHLRQFVDAMSPTLMLLSNPAALQQGDRDGRRQPCRRRAQPAGRPQGGPAQHGRRARPSRPGRNLALTPGKVVHRNRLIELIQYDADNRDRSTRCRC